MSQKIQRLSFFVGAVVLASSCSFDSIETHDESETRRVTSYLIEEEDCLVGSLNGKVGICHLTDSKTNSYVHIRVNTQGCINGHAQHPGDFLSDDPSCIPCVPTSCGAEGTNCGVIEDGCGGTLDCGSCVEPQTCGGGGTPNVCGCTPTTCEAQGKDCGSVDDGCGTSLECGTCVEPQICGGTGVANVCGGGEQGQPGPSCQAMSGTECQGESCCSTILVPGSTFPMGRYTEECDNCIDGCPPGEICDLDETPEHVASVSPLYLDKYEVTVGRMRQFLEEYDAWRMAGKPELNEGENPSIPGSGWQVGWLLPTDEASFEQKLLCGPNMWWPTLLRGDDTYPINCVNWFEAFAFCIWDGGRLPTEAEWEYAAAGGSANRLYPWGDAPIDATRACSWEAPGCPNDFSIVGSYSAGNARWGHADMAGSLTEWVIDWYRPDWYTVDGNICTDCANLTSNLTRVLRGGTWGGPSSWFRAADRYGDVYPTGHHEGVGFRCARDL